MVGQDLKHYIRKVKKSITYQKFVSVNKFMISFIPGL